MAHPLIEKLGSIADLPDADRALLARVISDVRTFPPRSDVIREGDNPRYVHLVVEGWACRYHMLAAGSRMITAFLLPGDFCNAHVTMLTKMDHGISTLTEARVAFVPADMMEALMDRPAIARALWWASLIDEAVLRTWLVSTGRRDSLTRVAHLICELHARLRIIGREESAEFTLPITQEELGDALGLTPVHISRVLRKLEDDGLMTFRRRHVTIRNVAWLAEAAEFDATYLHLNDRVAARLSTVA